jgi:hypothetical protein
MKFQDITEQLHGYCGKYTSGVEPNVKKEFTLR